MNTGVVGIDLRAEAAALKHILAVVKAHASTISIHEVIGYLEYTQLCEDALNINSEIPGPETWSMANQVEQLKAVIGTDIDAFITDHVEAVSQAGEYHDPDFWTPLCKRQRIVCP